MGDVYYTIAPVHVEDNSHDMKIKMIDYKDTRVLVQSIQEDQYQIVQLCSTNLQDFLDPELQPGAIINRGI